jgi:hypothetical protein
MLRCLLAAVSVVGTFACSAVAQTSVLFSFESGSVAEWDHWSYDSQLEAQGTIVHAGSYAMKYRHCEGESRYATAWAPPPEMDWSSYNRIRYWARSDVDTGQNTVKIKLQEDDGEEWIQKEGTLLDSTFQEVIAVLSSSETNGFQVATGVDWTLDLSAVTNVSLVFDAQDTHLPYYVYYYIDDIDLVYYEAPKIAEITSTPSAVDFGVVHPSPGNRRFESSQILLDYVVSGYTNAWSLQVYTTRPDGRPGLVGADDSSYAIPIKCWSGPTNDLMPNPEVYANWTGSWSYVTHETNAWHPTLGTSAAPPDSPFQLFLGIDASGMYTQAYSATAVVEIMIE